MDYVKKTYLMEQGKVDFSGYLTAQIGRNLWAYYSRVPGAWGVYPNLFLNLQKPFFVEKSTPLR